MPISLYRDISGKSERKRRREAARVAAVAAAIQAYLEAEAEASGRVPAGFQVPALRTLVASPVGVASAYPPPWAHAGRLELMRSRQDIALRKGR